MPWLKLGDTAANHPIAVAALEHPDGSTQLLNEVFGWAVRCALQSTAHLTDYVITRGTALQIAGESRADLVFDVATFCGYITETEYQGRAAFKLHDDPEFIHMRTKEEVEWERQRKTDNRNPALIAPVRHRDGDACRYCGLVVNWRARTGRIAGTYDHRQPGRAATVETLVVACTACNKTRGDAADADTRTPLLEPPLKPYYSQHTREWFAASDWANRNGYALPPAHGPEIPHGQRPAPAGNATTVEQRTGTPPAPAPTRQHPGGPPASAPPVIPNPVAPGRTEQEPAATTSPRPGPTGAGRGGSGRAGLGGGGTGADPPPPEATPQHSSPRRTRRGRRRPTSSSPTSDHRRNT